MTIKNNIAIMLSGIALAALALGTFLLAVPAHANPLFFVPTVQTATASTSPAYLAAAATSTLAFDSYSTGQPKATDSGVLLLQTTASSTSSVFTVSLQYSQDGIDWYNDNTASATTTNMSVGAAQTYSFTAVNTAVSLKTITVPMPTRYVRAVTVVSGAAGAVWQQIIPKRQSN